jgi:hypothetical protein
MSKNITSQLSIENRKSLYKMAGIAYIAMLGIMAVQIVIYILWPPPETAIVFFQLFQSSWIL